MSPTRFGIRLLQVAQIEYNFCCLLCLPVINKLCNLVESSSFKIGDCFLLALTCEVLEMPLFGHSLTLTMGAAWVKAKPLEASRVHQIEELQLLALLTDGRQVIAYSRSR